MPNTDTSAAQAQVRIRNLRKRFGDNEVLKGIDLDIQPGEVVVIIGKSGSGKSTLLRCINALERYNEGSLDVDGVHLRQDDPRSLRELRQHVGMIFQGFHLFPHLNAGHNVMLAPGLVKQQDWASCEQQARALLARVGLANKFDSFPEQLSGGQQQRVAIARALAYNPPVLLMDEPLSALDKQLREEIQFELKRIHHDTGITILYVTHDQEEALRLSDRIAVFNKGRIEQVGTGAELYEHPATRFVAGFIGHSNFLPVKLEARRGDVADIVLPDGRRLEGAPLRCDAANGADAALMLRPDRLHLLHEAGTDTPSIPVRVTDLSYLGDVMQVHLATNWNQDLDIRLPLRPGALPDWQVGSQGHLAWVNAHSQVHAAAA